MKIFYLLFLVSFSLFANNCADQYNNENFITAPEHFGEIADNKLDIYFGKDVKNFNKDFHAYNLQGEIYYLRDGFFLKQKDNYYPIKDGVWKLHVNKNGKVDELELAQNTLYQDPIEDIANNLNSDMENLWAKWDGDAYGYYMIPEYVQLNYKDFYISMKVFLYGSDGDSAGLKKAFIDFYIINNTKEVNKFIRCSKK